MIQSGARCLNRARRVPTGVYRNRRIYPLTVGLRAPHAGPLESYIDEKETALATYL